MQNTSIEILEQSSEGGKYWRFTPVVCRAAGRSAADLLALNLITDAAAGKFTLDDKYCRKLLAGLGVDSRQARDTIARLRRKGLISLGSRIDRFNSRYKHTTLIPSAKLLTAHKEAIKRRRFVRTFLTDLAGLLDRLTIRKAGCLRDYFAVSTIRKQQRGRKPSVEQINAVSGDREYIRRVRLLRAAGIVSNDRQLDLLIDLDGAVAAMHRQHYGRQVIEYRRPPPHEPDIPPDREKLDRLAGVKRGLKEAFAMP